MISSSDPRSHPWMYLIGAQVVSISGLAYIPSRSRSSRQAVFALSTFLTILTHLKRFQLSDNAGWRCMAMTFAWAQVLNSHDLLCLSQYAFENQRKLAKNSARIDHLSNITCLSRLRWAASMQWNLRRIGTEQAIEKHVSFSTGQKEHVPARAHFLLKCAAQLIAWLCYTAFGAIQPRPALELLAQDKEFILGGWTHMTSEDLGNRIMCTLFWYIGITSISQIMYNTLAISFVGLGFSPVRQWPPWFGYVSKAYTVRNFWGVTWHQTWRHLLSKNADFIVTQVLHLPKHGVLARYARISMTFLLSGLAHLGSDLAIGISANESGAVSYFLMQSVAIMIEDLVQGANRRMLIVQNQKIKRLIGFVWVAIWLLLVTPQWNYPPFRRMRPFKDDMINFAFLSRLGVTLPIINH